MTGNAEGLVGVSWEGWQQNPMSKEPPSVLVWFSYCKVQWRYLSPANMAFTLPAVSVICPMPEVRLEKNWVAVFNLDLETVGVYGYICNGDKKWREVLCECLHLPMLLLGGFFFLLSRCLSALFMHFTAF